MMALADYASVGLFKFSPDCLIGLNVVLVIMIDLWVFFIINGYDFLVEVEPKVIKAAVQIPFDHIILHQRRIYPLLLTTLALRSI